MGSTSSARSPSRPRGGSSSGSRTTSGSGRPGTGRPPRPPCWSGTGPASGRGRGRRSTAWRAWRPGRLIRNEAYECGDIDGLVARGDRFFGPLPPPEARSPVSEYSPHNAWRGSHSDDPERPRRVVRLKMFRPALPGEPLRAGGMDQTPDAPTAGRGHAHAEFFLPVIWRHGHREPSVIVSRPSFLPRSGRDGPDRARSVAAELISPGPPGGREGRPFRHSLAAGRVLRRLRQEGGQCGSRKTGRTPRRPGRIKLGSKCEKGCTLPRGRR